MRRLIFALLPALFFSWAVCAQSLLGFPPGTFTNQAALAPAAYQGPGDVVSGAKVLWGLRGYNAAYATGSNNAITVRRASDNTTQNIVILTTGALDIATANTFAGTDATCQGSTTGSSTTIAFTGCSATPKATDTVSGAGITQPSYLTACGAFVAGAGSCTLNAAQNIAVAEPVTMQVALFITEAFDQTGNGVNGTQGTAGSQPQLLPSCVNGLPCMNFTGGQNLAGTLGASSSQPYTLAAVALTTSGSTTQGYFGGNSFAYNLGFESTSRAYMYTNNASVAATASTNAWHAISGQGSGASAFIAVDGVKTPGTTGTSASGTNINLGTTNSQPLSGSVTEAMFYSSSTTFGQTQITNLCHNQYAYWGTATSC